MTKHPGIQKQEAFLTNLHSRQLYCPSCKGHHSYIELRGSNDWAKETPEKIYCPKTKEEVVHVTPLMGEQFLTTQIPC